MNIIDEVELLRRIPLFRAMAPARLKLLAFTSERITFRPAQSLFHQGEVAEAAYVILEGEADVVVESNGKSICVATVGRDSFVGEISILCDVPRTATVIAKGPLQTLKIGREEFLNLLQEFPEMAIDMMRVLAERLSATTADLTAAVIRDQ